MGTTGETPRSNINPQMSDLDFDNEVGDGDDELDNTKFIPVYKHSISYQQRQALGEFIHIVTLWPCSLFGSTDLVGHKFATFYPA